MGIQANIAERVKLLCAGTEKGLYDRAIAAASEFADFVRGCHASPTKQYDVEQLKMYIVFENSGRHNPAALGRMENIDLLGTEAFVNEPSLQDYELHVSAGGSMYGRYFPEQISYIDRQDTEGRIRRLGEMHRGRDMGELTFVDVSGLTPSSYVFTVRIGNRVDIESHVSGAVLRRGSVDLVVNNTILP